MRKLNIVLLSIVMFALLLTSVNAADKVIGKVHIKKGTEVAVFIPVGNQGHMPFIGTAFKDQSFYILDKVADGDDFVYKVDGQGFSHDCSTHGEEVFNIPNVFIVILESDIDGESVKVEIFEEK